MAAGNPVVIQSVLSGLNAPIDVTFDLHTLDISKPVAICALIEIGSPNATITLRDADTDEVLSAPSGTIPGLYICVLAPDGFPGVIVRGNPTSGSMVIATDVHTIVSKRRPDRIRVVVTAVGAGLTSRVTLIGCIANP